MKVNRRGAGVEATPASGTSASATVRRSTRKRAPTKSMTDMVTPLNTGRAAARNQFATPAITPKFDPSAPLHRTAMRLAKPNETLMSMSGSPVYPNLTTTAKKRGKAAAAAAIPAAQISIGQGRSLVVPEVRPGEPAPQLELDDEAKEKLESIASQINSMLAMSKK